MDEVAKSSSPLNRQAPCVMVQVERVAIEPTFQEGPNLLGEPFGPGEHRQPDQSRPARSDLNVARDTDIYRFDW